MTDAPTKEKVIDSADAKAEAPAVSGNQVPGAGAASGPVPGKTSDSKTSAASGTVSGTVSGTPAAAQKDVAGEVSESKADPEDFIHTSKSLKNPPPEQDQAVQERAKEVVAEAEQISSDPLKQFKFPGAVNPTPLMVARSNTWNKLLRAFVVYFKEVARVMDETAKLQDSAARAIDIPFLEGANIRVAAPTPHPGNYLRNASAEFKENEDLMFAPYGNESVSDIPITLLKLHKEAARTAAQASPLITRELIPRIEQIRRDLTQATSDFTKMGAKFKDAASITSQQKATEKEVQNYETAIDSVLAGHTPNTDPYVLKLSVEHQLQRQVTAENHLLDSYSYVEDAAKAVDKGVMSELQEIVKEFANALGVYGDIYVNAAAQLIEGVVSKPPLYELDSFTTREPHVFVNADVPQRSVDAAVYKHQNSNLARAVLKGDLERRTKFLKSFVKAEYILTPQTLIELKNGQPEVGIDLSDAKLETDHKHHGGDRFVLNARQVNSSSGKAHTWVFRSDKAKEWITALQKITGASSAAARAETLFGGLEGPAAKTTGVADAVDSSNVKGIDVAQKSATHGIAEPASASLPQTATKSPAAGSTGATGATGAAGSAAGSATGAVAGAAAGAAAGAGALGAAAIAGLHGDSKQSGSSAPADVDADSTAAVKSLNPEEDEQLIVAGVPSQSRERRPSNYKKDDGASKSLSLSTGASAGGEHGLEGVDVSTTAPQPLSYRKDNKDTSVPSSAGVSGTTDNDSEMSELSENGGYRKLSVDPALAADSNVQLAANADQSMAGIANKDLKVWDEINGFGSTKESTRTLDPAAASGAAAAGAAAGQTLGEFNLKENQIVDPVDDVPGLSTLGETQNKSASTNKAVPASTSAPTSAPTEAAAVAGEVGQFNLKESEIADPIDKVPGLSTLGETSASKSASKSVGTGVSPDASGAGPGVDTYHEQQGELAHATDKVAGLNKLNYTPVTETAPTEAGVVAEQVGEFNLKGSQISHPIDKVPGLDTLGERPTAGTKDISGSVPTEAAVVAGEVGEFNLKGDQISHPIDKVPGLDTLGDRPTGHALGADDGAKAVKSDIGTLRSHLGSSTDALEASKGSAIDDDADDNASVFSYDRKHRASTYTGDDYHEDNTLPPAIERRLTQTSHKLEDPATDSGIGAARTATEANDSTEKVLERRKSTISIHSTGRKNSRRATASYGGDDLKPLTASEPGKLFFADDLPATTSGK